MITDAVIARLKAEAAPLKWVQGAAEFAAITGRPNAVPTAFVFPVSERAGTNRTINLVSQEVTVRVAVVAVAANKQDGIGGAAIAGIEPVRASIRSALLGWHPSAEAGPMTFAGGRLLEFAHQAVWWLDEYEAQISIREAQAWR